MAMSAMAQAQTDRYDEEPPVPPERGWYGVWMVVAFAGFTWMCWCMGWLGVAVFTSGVIYLATALSIARTDLEIYHANTPRVDRAPAPFRPRSV